MINPEILIPNRGRSGDVRYYIKNREISCQTERLGSSGPAVTLSASCNLPPPPHPPPDCDALTSRSRAAGVPRRPRGEARRGGRDDRALQPHVVRDEQRGGGRHQAAAERDAQPGARRVRPERRATRRPPGNGGHFEFIFTFDEKKNSSRRSINRRSISRRSIVENMCVQQLWFSSNEQFKIVI